MPPPLNVARASVGSQRIGTQAVKGAATFCSVADDQLVSIYSVSKKTSTAWVVDRVILTRLL